MRDTLMGAIVGTFIFLGVLGYGYVFLNSKSEKIIGINMQNEIKEYEYLDRDCYGITSDGTHELLKSYKINKKINQE